MDTKKVVEYGWWGQENSPPPTLKTTKQLKGLGLAPLVPVGVIHTNKYSLKLYDPEDEKSVRKKRAATAAQLAALKKGRDRAAFNRALAEWREYDGFILEDKISVIRWARKVFKNLGDWLLLDTETTGLDSRDRIVEIAVVDLSGAVLLNSLVKPTGDWFMSAEAQAVHGITPKELTDAPTFAELYPKLESILENRKVLTYGAEFDSGMVARELARASLPLHLVESRYWHCLMDEYAAWCGEWSDYWKSYRWQPLCGSHRALGDCLAALSLLKGIAEDSDKLTYPDWLLKQGLAVGVDLSHEQNG